MDIKMTSDFRPRQAPSTASKPAGKHRKTSVESQTAPNTNRDTFHSSASKIFGDHMISGSTDTLRLDGPLPPSKTLLYYEPAEDDGIDWENLEKQQFGNRQVTLDNADSLRRNVDHMISVYVAAKSTLEEKYAGQEEILTEKMDRLNGLLDKAKKQLCSSYESTVGRFYESMGNKGAASSMGVSLSAAIDKRIAQMEDAEKTMQSFQSGADSSYVHRQLVMEVWAFNQREEDKATEKVSSENASPEDASPKSTSAKDGSAKDDTLYSLKDLEAAGMAAKSAAAMNGDGLGLMSDEELGICMASRYMKMASLLSHLGTDEKMSDMILKSFGTFLDKYSGNALSGSGAAAKTYRYALDTYDSTGDLREAVTQAARKYASDSFFSDFRNFGGNVSMSLSTRYNLDLDQFVRDLENSGPLSVLPSISGIGIHGFSSYI